MKIKTEKQPNCERSHFFYVPAFKLVTNFIKIDLVVWFLYQNNWINFVTKLDA